MYKVVVAENYHDFLNICKDLGISRYRTQFVKSRHGIVIDTSKCFGYYQENVYPPEYADKVGLPKRSDFIKD